MNFSSGTSLSSARKSIDHRADGLARASDPRAAGWLRRAHEALQPQAARITDAQLRQGFLHNIPHHREIMGAWADGLKTEDSGGASQR